VFHTYSTGVRGIDMMNVATSISTWCPRGATNAAADRPPAARVGCPDADRMDLRPLWIDPGAAKIAPTRALSPSGEDQ